MTFKPIGAALSVAILLGAAVPVLAQDATLSPEAEAGRVIYEETAGGVGCQLCHGMDGTGDIGPDIRGVDPTLILDQLRSNSQMEFITLSEQEVEQVALYLRHLHELEAH